MPKSCVYSYVDISSVSYLTTISACSVSMYHWQEWKELPSLSVHMPTKRTMTWYKGVLQVLWFMLRDAKHSCFITSMQTKENSFLSQDFSFSFKRFFLWIELNNQVFLSVLKCSEISSISSEGFATIKVSCQLVVAFRFFFPLQDSMTREFTIYLAMSLHLSMILDFTSSNLTSVKRNCHTPTDHVLITVKETKRWNQ